MSWSDPPPHSIPERWRMLAQSPSEDVLGLDAAYALSHWINWRHHQHGEHRYCASRAMEQGTVLPSLVVEMHGPVGHVATYKCEVAPVGAMRDGWLLLAPLVVIWNGARPEDSGQKGRMMIDHLVDGARKFKAASLVGGGVLIASGNLTKAKGGRRFFESLGWDIVGPDEGPSRSLLSRCPPVRAAATAVKQRIDRAVAPLRDAGKIEPEPISFALLTLS